MGDMRVMLRKTKGQGGWGTLYVLQQLDADGKPLPHFKAGDEGRCCSGHSHVHERVYRPELYSPAV